MNALTLGTSEIRQLDGLYSLNDLHKASGGEAKHQPALFMRNDQTQALIAELSSTDSQSIHTKTVIGKGKLQGTYVCRELVYAYAMWISPKFHLAVIRAFDAGQTVAASHRFNRRWLLSYDFEGKEQITPVPENACVMSVAQLLQSINEPNGMYIAPDLLADFIVACTRRLQQNVSFYQAKAQASVKTAPSVENTQGGQHD